MRWKLGLLVFAIFAPHIAPAFADCMEKRSALSDFGSVPLGARLSELPRGIMRLPNCEVIEKLNYADCEFRDKSGVSYWVVGEEVTRKVITIGSSTDSMLKLPFGLSVTDGIAQVVTKIASRSDSTTLKVYYQGRQISLTTGLCLLDAAGTIFTIELTFGEDGRFREIAAIGNFFN